MQIKGLTVVIVKGTSRAVLISERLPFVIKLPLIRLSVLPRTFASLRDAAEWRAAWYCIKRPFGSKLSMRWRLFSGIWANWMEFWCYVTTQNSFLQPTYFSLLGFINIQKKGTPVGMEYLHFSVQMENLIGSMVFYEDYHHFSKGTNFCIDGGKLKILDYGSSCTGGIVLKSGASIQKNFNPQYRCDE
ncbi:MAG: hypothetical protein ACD_81C00080G0002 [uncultured bacterium]|uniref:Uncharacterized protein n=1 Tax=Candidatus Wolfebacteria bacterium GW2011_GWE2_44_13 TaxID=1619017 RepID=A0A0G1HA88_9BACT|nr:MAG: hypothetical protein ACD_81C00080G0002 [uncultured bacterium]KKT43463.1 MAG: hypothetical protein UW32_C0001G0055 [Candidatus Wolfebacteria bacterium GW2011_GWE2_44_13]